VNAYEKRKRSLASRISIPLYLSFFSNDADPEQEARQEEIWSLSALDDSETIAKLTSGVKRFKLPPEYDYINLRREKAKDFSYYFSELAPIAREYETDDSSTRPPTSGNNSLKN
jgi:hypothetical protein